MSAAASPTSAGHLSLSTVADAIAVVANVAVLPFSHAQAVGKFSKRLIQQAAQLSNGSASGEPNTSLLRARDELAALSEACVDRAAKSVVLNNLASVHSKLGDKDGALTCLRMAAKLEGGYAKAQPKTMINLSASLHACGRFTESAAVATKAVEQLQLNLQRITQPSSRPASREQRPASRDGAPLGDVEHVTTVASVRAALAAAKYNLAAALESSGETTFAEATYKEVVELHSIHDGSADNAATAVFARAARDALHHLATAQSRGIEEEWAATVGSKIQRTIAAGDHRKRGGQNLSKRLPAIESRPKLPPRAQSSLAVVPASSASPELFANSSANREHSRAASALLRSDISEAYRSTALRKYHMLPPLLTPVPYESRTSLDASTTMVRCSPSPTRHHHLISSSQDIDWDTGMASTEMRAKELPEWNSDPVLHAHALSHHVVHPAERRNETLMHEIDIRFIPRALVPLVEDLRYKEGTRRTMIVKEWRRRFDVIRRTRLMTLFMAEEDAARVHVEVEEARVRRVVRQWMIGKLLFAESTLRLDREEAIARDGLAKSLVIASQKIQATAAVLHPQALEEVDRHSIVAAERASMSRMWIDKEASQAMVETRLQIKQNVKGLAYSLALWCMEGVIPESEVPMIEDKARKQSIHVLERFAVFGRQKRPS